jgi:hypothetical protein
MTKCTVYSEVMKPLEAELIVVDYGTSFIGAFANATSAAIMSARVLDILSAVKFNPAADSNMPMSKAYDQDLTRSAARGSRAAVMVYRLPQF